MRRWQLRLGTDKKGRADLDAARSERESRSDSPAIGNAARCNDGNSHSVRHLGHERERPWLRHHIVCEKHAAMAAGFSPLGNDCVDAARFQPTRFRDGRRGTEDQAPSGLEAIDKGFVGETDMKADNLWL